MGVAIRTLKASLAASGIAIVAWLAGLTRMIWPAHPQLAGFVLTLVLTILLYATWPESPK